MLDENVEGAVDYIEIMHWRRMSVFLRVFTRRAPGLVSTPHWSVIFC